MRERLADLLHALVVVAIAAALAFLSTRHGFERDFSHARSASLGASSVAVLAALDGPVEVISYARRQGGLRGLIGEFVARYQRAKPDLALRFVDPDADPDAMRAAGIAVDGELELRYDDRSERLKVLSEQEFSGALLRLSRGSTRIVAFLEGEGERDPLGARNADLGQFVQSLAARGLRAVPLPLARTGTVPQNTDLVVVADPQVDLPAAVAHALVDYLERGGALLWLAEPGARPGLEPLAEALGLAQLPGTVVDAGGEAFGLSDPSFVAASRYPDHVITRDFALTTLYPQAAALARRENARWAAASLLQSGTRSWNETGHIPRAGEAADSVRHDAAEGEIAGPLDLGFALTRISPRPDRGEQRVVVLGDGDFLSNSFLGNGGNREFGQRVFDWLLGDDAQVQVPDRSAADRELRLSQRALGLIALGFLVVLPLLLVATGLLVWWRRRR
ncbi:MAG: ABC transporter [Lysobacteraceae bacterium]|nr:MAG: ABC transporter [Xanthomonadaceae bacterium]